MRQQISSGSFGINLKSNFIRVSSYLNLETKIIDNTSCKMSLLKAINTMLTINNFNWSIFSLLNK